MMVISPELAKRLAPNLFERLSKHGLGDNEHQSIAEAYHDAKSKGIENDFTKAVEQFLPKEQPKQSELPKTESNPALKDVDSTTKALNEINYDQNEIPYSLDYLPTDKKAIAAAYHADKAAGKETPLTKAVESILSKEKNKQLELSDEAHRAIEEGIKSGAINDIEASMLNTTENKIQFLKQVAEQAKGEFTGGGKVGEGGEQSRAARKKYGEEIVDEALRMFPEKEKKSKDKAEEPAVSKTEGKPTDVVEPSQEQQLKDIQDGNVVTFEYNNESEVPEVFKDKISSKGEINGKPYVKVTMAKSLADFHLQEQSIFTKPEINNEGKKETNSIEESQRLIEEMDSAAQSKKSVREKEKEMEKVAEKNGELGKKALELNRNFDSIVKFLKDNNKIEVKCP